MSRPRWSLLDDDFSSIVGAVRLGRRIFDNLKKAMAYILAIHVPIAGISLIPVLFNWPLVLMPVHIVFLELIIDPACSIAFESEREEPNVMRRPARDPKEPIFGVRTTKIALLQGFSALFIVAAVFFFALRLGQTETHARAMAFTTLIIANLALIWSNRSWTSSVMQSVRSRNVALWWVTGAALTLLTLVLSVQFLRELFHLSSLGMADLSLCVVAGCASILWFEATKLITRKSSTQGKVA